MYAGLEFGAECYCGHRIQAPNASESDCNMECKGEKNNMCGGANRLTIFRLELSQESARRCEYSIASHVENQCMLHMCETVCVASQVRYILYLKGL